LKTLYLHIGTRKTATSSIQKTIFNNRKIFEKNGLYYPENWRKAHNLELFCMFTDRPERYSFNVFNKYTKEQVEKNNINNRNNIIKEVQKTACEKILFSAEDVSALGKKNIENLKLFINTELNIYKIIIIVSVRDILSYVTSDLQQYIKDGHGKVNIQHYKDFYRAKIEKFIEVFGRENIIVYKFEDAIKHELGPVGYFFDIINFPRDVLSEIKIDKTNEGISNRAIDLMEYINVRIPLTHNGKLSKGRCLGDTKVINRLSGDRFIPKKVFQEQVLEINHDNLIWLKDNFNIDYTTTKSKEPHEIKYDVEYVNEVVNIYSKLKPFIQKLVFDYFVDKSLVLQGESKANVDQIVSYIKDNFSYVSIFEIQAQPSTLKTTKRNVISKGIAVNKIRDLAIEIESVDLKLARKIMLIAHEERKHGTLIKDKLDEYDRKLNLTSTEKKLNI